MSSLIIPKYHRNEDHSILIADFAAHFINKNGWLELIKQFNSLIIESQNQELALGLTVTVGDDSINESKNRFPSILPFDQNRVKIGKKGPPFDYINASYIPFSGDEKNIEYIVTQDPIETTLSDFWQMVWEQNTYLIVMLTKTVKGDNLDSFQYWPEDIEEKVTYGRGNQLKLVLIKEINKESYIERDLRMEHLMERKNKEIKQLQIQTWLDHSSLDLNQLYKLLFRFHEIQTENVFLPPLIHCRSGIGRTGTFICIDRIVKWLNKGNQKINVYENVLELRRSRNFMVQRQDQYIFIHEYLNHFIKKYLKTERKEETVL